MPASSSKPLPKPDLQAEPTRGKWSCDTSSLPVMINPAKKSQVSSAPARNLSANGRGNRSSQRPLESPQPKPEFPKGRVTRSSTRKSENPDGSAVRVWYGPYDYHLSSSSDDSDTDEADSSCSERTSPKAPTSSAVHHFRNIEKSIMNKRAAVENAFQSENSMEKSQAVAEPDVPEKPPIAAGARSCSPCAEENHIPVGSRQGKSTSAGEAVPISTGHRAFRDVVVPDKVIRSETETVSQAKIHENSLTGRALRNARSGERLNRRSTPVPSPFAVPHATKEAVSTLEPGDAKPACATDLSVAPETRTGEPQAVMEENVKLRQERLKCQLCSGKLARCQSSEHEGKSYCNVLCHALILRQNGYGFTENKNGVLPRVAYSVPAESELASSVMPPPSMPVKRESEDSVLNEGLIPPDSRASSVLNGGQIQRNDEVNVAEEIVQPVPPKTKATEEHLKRHRVPKLAIWAKFTKMGKRPKTTFYSASCNACLLTNPNVKAIRGEKNAMEKHFYSCPFVDEAEKDVYRSTVPAKQEDEAHDEEDGSFGAAATMAGVQFGDNSAFHTAASGSGGNGGRTSWSGPAGLPMMQHPDEHEDLVTKLKDHAREARKTAIQNSSRNDPATAVFILNSCVMALESSRVCEDERIHQTIRSLEDLIGDFRAIMNDPGAAGPNAALTQGTLLTNFLRNDEKNRRPVNSSRNRNRNVERDRRSRSRSHERSHSGNRERSSSGRGASRGSDRP